MQIGGPELFHDNVSVRIQGIERSVRQYRDIAQRLKSPIAHMVDKDTAFYLKGFGNNEHLLAVTKDLFFNSRELLDLYSGRMNRATAGSANQTPHSFVKLMGQLTESQFEHKGEPIFRFMETNLLYIFLVRKIRNEIKENPSAAEFHFNTNRFEMRIKLPVKQDDKSLIEHLEIGNIEDGAFSMTVVLDEYFPEAPKFWQIFGENFDKSFLGS